MNSYHWGVLLTRESWVSYSANTLDRVVKNGLLCIPASSLSRPAPLIIPSAGLSTSKQLSERVEVLSAGRSFSPMASSTSIGCQDAVREALAALLYHSSLPPLQRTHSRASMARLALGRVSSCSATHKS